MQSLSRKRKEALARELGTFVRQYGRRAQRGQEPNDRSYDRQIEWTLRRLKPEECDLLLNGEEDERFRF